MEDQPLETQINKVNSLKSRLLEPAEKCNRKHFQQLEKSQASDHGPEKLFIADQALANRIPKNQAKCCSRARHLP